MNKIIVSAEATCDLPMELADKYGISIAPMEYMVGNDRYTTDDGLPAVECFKRMRAGALTSTGLINQACAEEYFEGLLSSGADVVHLGFSSTLSGTYLNMKTAAERLGKKYPEQKVIVVDTRCGSGGQGLMAMRAAELVKDGATFEEVAFFAQNSGVKFCHSFVADDLTYLSRSGRVSKIVAMLGNALNLKPVMYLNSEGIFAVMKKVMTRKRSVMALADSVIENFSGECNKIIVLHADCRDEADSLCERLKKAIRIEPIVCDFGMVIGSHCGPGTLGVFYMGKKRN